MMPSTVCGLDAATRFYMLWRYTYKASDLDAGEAIIFANARTSNCTATRFIQWSAALVAKNKAKYRLLDYTGAATTPHSECTLRMAASTTDRPLHRLLW